ncbi:MAG TPA: molybdopterin-binding protein [Sphingomonadales bacterium]
MSESRRVTACLLIIGDEILSGRTRDANLSYLARWLNGEGVELREARVIPDDRTVIVRTVNEVRRAFDYVFTTGGIGPTHDDITTDCVAEAFGVPIHFNAEAERELMARLTGPMTEGRRRMTRIPEGATLIRNPVSGAPGFRLGNVHVLAGIPAVMQAMLETIRGTLEGGRPVQSATLHVFAGESRIAATLLEVQERHPDVSIGSYPFGHQDRYGANLVLRSPDGARLAAATEELRQALIRDGFEPGIGEATPTPEDIV